jgi:hypothetical protein
MNRMIFAVATEADDRGFVWDRIRTCQAELFEAGPVEIKFAYYGLEPVGAESRPFVATRWCTDADDMIDLMDHAKANCVCGCFVHTTDILEHALQETRQAPVAAVVIVADRFHGDEDDAMATAKLLHAAGTRVFVFQQGAGDGEAFEMLANLTGGAYVQYNPHVERIAKRLPRMFDAITQYTIGGMKALEAREDDSAALLLDQMNANQLVPER